MTFVGTGLVRVPRAWGTGGEGMADGARIALPYPEAGVVERDSLEEQTEAVADALPDRPVVVGGCCCAHLGALHGLAQRGNRLSLVWIDAHGDLNTPETSPSGNLWGMPFRIALDAGHVRSEDSALIGARNLDPPEIEFLEAAGVDDSLGRALAGSTTTYVALDLDVLDPAYVDVHVPEPGGFSPEALESLLRELVERTPVAGIGITGHLRTDRNAAVAARMLAAVGF